ncbi:MAG TPA: 30S ribosome-binding factor RbfA [Planctomycetes bacterium]|nr:30S ribosome-binding factor RbfA [Planctomycetota bacterium]
MASRRALKVAQAIREVVSMAILTELKDPRIRDVTVTYVEVSADLRHAKVHVSVMGDEPRQQLSLRGLRSASGYLQALCAERLELRYTPRIVFLLDQGVKKSIEVSRILAQVLPSQADQDEAAPEGLPASDAQAATSSGADDAPAAPPSESIHPPPGAERE